MARVRYRVENVPTRAGAGAFMPSFATNPGASSHGEVQVVGFPGTLPVPSPHTPGTRMANTGVPTPQNLTQGQAVAPDVIYPAVYVAGVRNMGPRARGMRMVSDNVLPTPAHGVTRLPGTAMRSPQAGGIRQIPWPRVLIDWPSRGPAATG